MKDVRIELWFKLHGEDAEVYFSVFKGVCKSCIKQYLTDDIGSEPLLFKLKDIIKNEVSAGGNIENLISTGGVHNFCCFRKLIIKPKNTVWNAELQQYVLVRNTYGVERKSKITVNVKWVQ